MPARSALVGNPSDGFGGATIAFALEELEAIVQAEPALGVELEAQASASSSGTSRSWSTPAGDGGYPDGGPLALLMAAAKRLRRARIPMAGRPGVRLEVSARRSRRRVGLAGSSAIVIGALRALGKTVRRTEIPDDDLPRFALACETEELGIPAGLQDR